MSLRVALSMWAAQNHQHGKVRHEDVDEFGAQEQSVALWINLSCECCDWHADERTCCMARRLIACG
jgi:hypothetical protein